MSNLTKRVLTAVIGIASLFLVLWVFDGLANEYVRNALLIFLLVECSMLIGLKTTWMAVFVGVGFGLQNYLSEHFIESLVSPASVLTLLLICFLVPALLLHVFCTKMLKTSELNKEAEDENGHLGLATGCLVVLVAFCLALHAIQMLFGMALLVSVLAISWSTDTGAYFVGKAIGKKPLAKSISPNKTIEGLWGGLLVGILVSLLLGFFWLQPTHGWPTVGVALLALITPIVAVLGDLDESILKRWVKAKDSADLLPGHGGLLDRVDSLVYAAPVVLLLATIFVAPVI